MKQRKPLIEGKIYHSAKLGHFTGKRVEDLESGDRLDWGVFDGFSPKTPTQGENTHNVRFRDGMHYTETKGAIVRVYLDS